MAITHVQARWFHAGRYEDVRLIVVHCTVSPNGERSAEGVAEYFRTTDRHASAHEVADQNSVVECVYAKDTAFAAAGANSDGWHIELCGYPDWTRAKWLEDDQLDMLKLAAARCRYWAQQFDIPFHHLTGAELKAGKAGFTDHNTISQTYPGTGHWDPGPNFPWDVFMALVNPPKPSLDSTEESMLIQRRNNKDHRLLIVNGWTYVAHAPRTDPNPGLAVEVDESLWNDLVEQATKANRLVKQ